jgi:hypothetical protein
MIDLAVDGADVMPQLRHLHKKGGENARIPFV